MSTSFTISGMPDNTLDVIGKIYQTTMAGRIQFNAQDGQPYVLGTPTPHILTPGVGVPGAPPTPTLPSVAEWVGDILGYYFARCYEVALQADVQALQAERQQTANAFRNEMMQAIVIVERQAADTATEGA